MSGFTKQPVKETNSTSSISSTPLKSIEEELRWVDILATDETGNSALMIGIRDNKEDTVKFIIDRALSVNKLSDVLQIVNKDDENAYSLALRAENVALLRIIEDATEKEKKQNFRKSRKFLKYKSTESFKASPKRIEKMHRPKSEEAVGSASTSDVEPEIDDSLQFKNNQSEIHEALVKSLSELQSPGFEKRPSLTDSEGKSVEKTPTIKNLHSDSFTFEHETIDFTAVPNPGFMNSLGCKVRNLMSGRRVSLL
uniref:Uncharacterized protein n=1 Tax=Panagrolaimus sp. ES5 TaxID=591445 RepID=A0AC34GUF2_9BILA